MVIMSLTESQRFKVAVVLVAASKLAERLPPRNRRLLSGLGVNPHGEPFSFLSYRGSVRSLVVGANGGNPSRFDTLKENDRVLTLLDIPRAKLP
jgi:hypothetical protein